MKCRRHFVCLRLTLTRIRLAKTATSAPSLATWGEMRASESTPDGRQMVVILRNLRSNATAALDTITYSTGVRQQRKKLERNLSSRTQPHRARFSVSIAISKPPPARQTCSRRPPLRVPGMMGRGHVRRRDVRPARVGGKYDRTKVECHWAWSPSRVGARRDQVSAGVAVSECSDVVSKRNDGALARCVWLRRRDAVRTALFLFHRTRLVRSIYRTRRPLRDLRRDGGGQWAVPPLGAGCDVEHQVTN